MLHVENGLLLIASPPITRRYSYAESASTIARQHIVPWRDESGRKVCETMTTDLIAEWGADNCAAGRLMYDTVSFERADGSTDGAYELLLMNSYGEYGLYHNGANVARSIYCGGNTKLGLYVTSVQFDGSFTSASCRIYYLKNYGTGELGSSSVGSAVKLKSFVESAPSDKHYTVTETIS